MLIHPIQKIARTFARAIEKVGRQHLAGNAIRLPRGRMTPIIRWIALGMETRTKQVTLTARNCYFQISQRFCMYACFSSMLWDQLSCNIGSIMFSR